MGGLNRLVSVTRNYFDKQLKTVSNRFSRGLSSKIPTDKERKKGKEKFNMENSRTEVGGIKIPISPKEMNGNKGFLEERNENNCMNAEEEGLQQNKNNGKVKFKVRFPKGGDPIFRNPEIFLTPEEYLLNQGYYNEIHEVESEDGFIISLLRIPFPKGLTPETMKKKDKKRPPVLFTHGISANAISFFLNKEENCLGFQLVERGYDVWAWNVRGSKPSKKHTKLTPRSNKFWEFSFNEMGKYDIPAVFNYILEKTGYDQLSCVGHSMGNACIFIAASYHPEIVSKIKVLAACAPAVYIHRARTVWLSGMSKFFPMSLMSTLNGGEFYSRETLRLSKQLMPWLHLFKRSTKIRHGTWMFWKCFETLGGKNREQIDWSIMPTFAAHVPSSLSCQTYDHFLQLYRTGKFMAYDYGQTKNVKRYGQPNPPEYDLTKSTFPIAVFYGENDLCVSPEDVNQLCQELPNVVLKHKVDCPKFSHMDFIAAKDAHTLLNTHILEVFSQYSKP